MMRALIIALGLLGVAGCDSAGCDSTEPVPPLPVVQTPDQPPPPCRGDKPGVCPGL